MNNNLDKKKLLNCLLLGLARGIYVDHRNVRRKRAVQIRYYRFVAEIMTSMTPNFFDGI